MFKLINTCTEAKQAWEILQTAHEGTSKVRMSKLQLLATKFENLRMEDEETISEFNTRIRDIANSTFALGEKIPEEKLARKILRSLPKRFNMKVTAIEESQDLSTMKVDELIGSLQTFEMSLDDKPEKKMKNLAFKSEESQTDDELSEALAYLTKNFNKSLSQLQARYKPNVPDKRSNIKSQGKSKEENTSEQNKEVRCFECEGFGHIRPECPNFLRKQKKGMAATLSDSEEEKEEEPTTKAFAGTFETSSSISNEDLLQEELDERYNNLTIKWEQSCELIRRQDKEMEKLAHEKKALEASTADLKEQVTLLAQEKEASTAELRKQVTLLSQEKEALEASTAVMKEQVTLSNSKLTEMTKSVRMLNKGTDMLEEVLELGRNPSDKKGLGYDNYSNAPEKKIPPKINSQDQMSNHMSQHPSQHKHKKTESKPQQPARQKKQVTKTHHLTQHKQKRFEQRTQPPAQQKKHMPDHMSQHHVQHVSPQYKEYKGPLKRCKHCGKTGHLISECFYLHGYPQKPKSPSQNKRKILPPRMKYKEVLTKVWKPTPPQQAHTSRRISPSKNWYFDSGDRHWKMTGDKRYLRELKSHLKGSVTFGDGVKGRVIGIGKLAGPNTPCLDDVLLVEGHTANLISISQLCEQGLKVHFNNHECTIANDQEVVMKGTKSSDKCYTWTPQNNGPEIACLPAKEDIDKMSHQMSQHLYNGQEAEEILVRSVRVPLGIHTLKNVS
ncbi:gag-protease polyprotein [Trifolium repens]|nr:gag-protease polyprotein [Trifolium repens]